MDDRHFYRGKRGRGQLCSNPKCGDLLQREALVSIVPFCASCRLAGQWGAALVGVLAMGVKIGQLLVTNPQWLTWLHGFVHFGQ